MKVSSGVSKCANILCTHALKNKNKKTEGRASWKKKKRNVLFLEQVPSEMRAVKIIRKKIHE